ncbi:YbaB/EbfC family nucleoid-associated protein [Actinocatenispora sera]|uniref:YbaB/EbfC family nucleoid-associated protein n=1 Tax=Actinocatenispora sera TaxID=390989 RepID=UPI0033C990A7
MEVAVTEEDPLSRIERTAKDTIARYQRFRAGTDGLTATATSPDNAVEVTVTPAGALRDLKLNPKAKQYPLDKLAATILAAATAATTAAATKYQQESREFIGERELPHLDLDGIRTLLSDGRDV